MPEADDNREAGGGCLLLALRLTGYLEGSEETLSEAGLNRGGIFISHGRKI